MFLHSYSLQDDHNQTQDAANRKTGMTHGQPRFIFFVVWEKIPKFWNKEAEIYVIYNSNSQMEIIEHWQSVCQ